MAKISHGAHTWRSEGLAKKYKELAKSDDTVKHKAKKNTRKWCKGKVGGEHKLQRHFHRHGWDNRRTKWIRTRCVECHKEFNANDPAVPLFIELDKFDGRYYPIQVKLDGKALPIDYRLYHTNTRYCWECNEWHSRY